MRAFARDRYPRRGGCSLVSNWLASMRKGGDRMTDYELLALLLAFIALPIATVKVMLSFFEYLDKRYKKK